MARQALKWTGGLIGLYLVAKNWNGVTRVISSSGSAGSGVIKTLQGR